MKKIGIGIIGCGNIGYELAKRLKSDFLERCSLRAVCDTDRGRMAEIRKNLFHRVKFLSSDELIDNVDFVIEAASPAVSFDIASMALKKNKDVLIISVGGLLDKYDKLMKLALKSKASLYLPSGALCGIDGVLAASRRNIKKIKIRTTKPVKGLIGAPYLKKKNIDISRLDGDRIIFSGKAVDAVKAFPKNINISALVSIAGIGPDKTYVEIAASSKIKRNTHQLFVEGDFGTFSVKVENLPSPRNPKTSYMAILSMEAVIAKFLSSVKVGT